MGFKLIYYIIYTILILIYRLNLVVHYDDAMFKLYNNQKRVETKLREVMLHVEEMFHERDTLTTVVELGAETVPIKRLKGENWENRFE